MCSSYGLLQGPFGVDSKTSPMPSFVSFVYANHSKPESPKFLVKFCADRIEEEHKLMKRAETRYEVIVFANFVVKLLPIWVIKSKLVLNLSSATN